MKYLLAILFSINALYASAQEENLNQYKYIIVENQYEFQNEANQYRFNELAVFELKKRNFTAFRNTEILPEDLNRGACNALQLKMKKSGTFRVYLVLSLENCAGETVFTTKKGKGTTKSFDKAFFEALRDAMTSLDEVDYKYSKPAYLKTAKNSELKTMGIDSVLTQSGQPGEREKESVKEIKEIPQFNKKVEDALQKEVTQQEKKTKNNYLSKDKKYALVKTDQGFDIYKSDVAIGTLKKNKRGSYLVVTTDFIGIGYDTEDGISIEYTVDEKDLVLDFVKG